MSNARSRPPNSVELLALFVTSAAITRFALVASAYTFVAPARQSSMGDGLVTGCGMMNCQFEFCLLIRSPKYCTVADVLQHSIPCGSVETGTRMRSSVQAGIETAEMSTKP